MKPIGVVGFYCGLNYGSHLTNYATYRFLKENGYSPLMIDIALTHSRKRPLCQLFYELPYEADEVLPRFQNKLQLKSINELCDEFVVTSDQQLHAHVYRIVGKTPVLDFITKNKKIIVYAASWGNDYFTGTERERALMSYFLRQVDHFSVRENSAVAFAEEEFGLKAQFVLDPIFLCDSSEYSKLAAKSRIALPSSSYAFCYILDIKQSHISLFDKLKKQNFYTPVLLTDAAKLHENRENIDIEVLRDFHVEDWINYIQNCDYYITDSFHGACVGILFKKEIVVLLNNRGQARILSLMNALGLNDRIVENVEDAASVIENAQPINYDKVYEALLQLKESSMSWLLSAIKEKQQKKPLSTFDICDARSDYLEQKILKLEKKLSNLLEFIESNKATNQENISLNVGELKIQMTGYPYLSNGDIIIKDFSDVYSCENLENIAPEKLNKPSCCKKSLINKLLKKIKGWFYREKVLSNGDVYKRVLFFTYIRGKQS